MLKNSSLLLILLAIAMTALCQTQPASEQEKNKTIARAFFEDVLGQGKLEKYSDSHTADFVAHGSERDFSLAPIEGARSVDTCSDLRVVAVICSDGFDSSQFHHGMQCSGSQHPEPIQYMQ
jgi:hypothetical protein